MYEIGEKDFKYPLDHLSELFLLQEFYTDLMDDDVMPLASKHLEFVKLLERYECIAFETDDNEYIHIEVANDYKVGSAKLKKKDLLPYEKYLLQELWSLE